MKSSVLKHLITCTSIFGVEGFKVAPLVSPLQSREPQLPTPAGALAQECTEPDCCVTLSNADGDTLVLGINQTIAGTPEPFGGQGLELSNHLKTLS